VIVAGGKPSKGTAADQRLSRNRTTAKPDPGGNMPKTPTRRTAPPALLPKPKRK
jgi:hypothetical protein